MNGIRKARDGRKGWTKRTVPFLCAALLFVGALALGADDAEIARLMADMAKDDFAGQRSHDRLVEIGSPAADALLAGLRSPVPRVRYWSASAIARIGDQRGYDPLVALAKDDPDPIVRSTALWHLQTYGKDAVYDLAVRKLQDTDRMVRGWAMRLLRENGRTEALPALRELLKSDDVFTRVDAVYAVVALMDSGQLDLLRGLLADDPNRDIRLQALRCLTTLGHDPRILVLMIDALLDSDVEVRRLAAQLLRRGTDQVFGYVPTDDEDERRAAAGRWRAWYEKNVEALRWNEEKRRFEIAE
ncbi:MAG: HEAT repeat domain-containing protein [Planctomycetota bacterium]